MRPICQPKPFEIGSEQEDSSGGETRTLNLAGLSRQDVDLLSFGEIDPELDS